jgi:hypothetical protein
MLVRHTFPLDGEYLIQVKLFRSNIESVRGLESREPARDPPRPASACTWPASAAT